MVPTKAGVSRNLWPGYFCSRILCTVAAFLPKAGEVTSSYSPMTRSINRLSGKPFFLSFFPLLPQSSSLLLPRRGCG